MFYKESPQKALRFGDVVHGFILTFPSIDSPTDNRDFKIDINATDLCVVLTPCCSIKNKVINLSPLKKVPSNYYKNPFLAQDMTRINRMMSRYDAMSPIKREKLSPREVEAMTLEKGYQFMDKFVYEGNNYFIEYDVEMPDGTLKKASYYMIEFKNIFKIECKLIENSEKYPLESKLLQLSVDTRKELVDKLSAYYRLPDEDIEG